MSLWRGPVLSWLASLIISAALLLYLLPIVLLLVGAALAGENALLVSSFSADLAAILGGLFGFVLGLAINKILSLRQKQDSSLNPRLIKCQGQLIASQSV